MSRRRIVELHRQSRLRERLQGEIDEVKKYIQEADHDLQHHYQQVTRVQANDEINVLKQQQEMVSLQYTISQLQGQKVTLQHRLNIAMQDLATFHDAMVEVEVEEEEEKKSCREVLMKHGNGFSFFYLVTP